MRKRRMYWELLLCMMISFIVVPCISSFAETTATYTYDDLNRLIRVQYGDGSSIEYGYDEVGNRTVKETQPPCSNLPVRIAGGTPQYFSSLQAAYDAAGNGAIIQIQALTFLETLNFNRPVSVNLQGGYDCGYLNNIKNTMLNGSMTIGDGSVTIEGGSFIVQN